MPTSFPEFPALVHQGAVTFCDFVTNTGSLDETLFNLVHLLSQVRSSFEKAIQDISWRTNLFSFHKSSYGSLRCMQSCKRQKSYRCGKILIINDTKSLVFFHFYKSSVDQKKFCRKNLFFTCCKSVGFHYLWWFNAIDTPLWNCRHSFKKLCYFLQRNTCPWKKTCFLWFLVSVLLYATFHLTLVFDPESGRSKCLGIKIHRFLSWRLATRNDLEIKSTCLCVGLSQVEKNTLPKRPRWEQVTVKLQKHAFSHYLSIKACFLYCFTS